MKQIEHLALGKLMYQINDNKDTGIVLILTNEQCQEVINGYMGIKENYENMEKAIEILKDKIWVNKAINYRICWKNDTLTEKEFELLKEVLENEKPA